MNLQQYTDLTLDAANQFHKLAATVFLFSQIFNYLALSSELLYFVSEEALQRNGRDCVTFAWEDLCWATQKGDLHSKLAVLKNSEDDVKHLQRAKQLVAKYLCKQQGALTAIDYQMLDALSLLHWVDYSKLEKNPEEWQMFFMNTQAVRRPDFLQEPIAKWLIERPSLDKKIWVIHNIRISYCEHLIRAALHHAQPLQENEFIVTEICKTHQLPVEKLGAVLRNAVSKSLVSQVKRLLDLSAVDVNEVPQSAMTALDRAEDLPTSTSKTEIKAMLLEKNAKSGAASSSRMHVGGLSRVDPIGGPTALRMDVLPKRP